MGIRTSLAKAASAVLTWGLRTIAHRPAGNLPGKVALKIDPRLVRELRVKLERGSVVIVGTNGKTTVTNLIANVFEQAGRSVLCNRTGANLKSGITSALLQGKPSDWGVIECDELWLAKVAPDLQPTYIVLLDLFRDQLDRCGEIDRIQDSIIKALASTPATTLVFNADDPLCAYVAEHCDNRAISFGVAESMGLDQNRVTDATMCQNCLHMFEYEYRQYGQLGAYACPHCGFARPHLDFQAKDVQLSAAGLSFVVEEDDAQANQLPEPLRIESHLAGSYMVYNLLAVAAASLVSGCDAPSIVQAIKTFDPKNGRLQEYHIDGRNVLLNLAKNPTGFNQNLRIVEADRQPRGVAFFINDQVVDGHDISWIWDIDFEEIAGQPEVVVFAGGSRRNDLQVRLKYAGVNAELIDSIDDVFTRLNELQASGTLPVGAPVYAIANYSAMPPVHRRLDALAKAGESVDAGNDTGAKGADAAETGAEADAAKASAKVGGDTAVAATDENTASASAIPSTSASTTTPIVIAHMLPDLLNLYGDGGNVRILEQRLRWRGIPVEVRRFDYDDPIDLDDVDLVFLGGSPDREQRLATDRLAEHRDPFVRYIEEGGPLLAICGSFQILGRTWLFGDEEVAGLSILNMETRRPGTSADRLIDNVAIDAPMATAPVIGFENHAGRTYLDEGVQPFGCVISKTGSGNNDDPHTPAADGVLQGRVLGTYFHGVLLAKNPEVADWALSNALERHAERTGEAVPKLEPLDDSVELAANRFMANRLL